ncbi:C1 family peptidase [Mycoplasma sp. 4044]
MKKQWGTNMIDWELLNKWKNNFKSNKNLNVLSHSIIKNGINNTVYNNDVIARHPHVFSHELKTGDITNQKQSGRCWIFASLNMARVQSIEKLNIENFEFSENYFNFWEKVEKANTFLTNIVAYGLELDLNDRLMQRFLQDPVGDGGYYAWWESLVHKYGAVPKQVMPETISSEATDKVSELLNNVVIMAALKMRQEYANNKKADLDKIRIQTLDQVYSICAQAFGIPPYEFDFEYYDKDKKFHRLKDMTPMSFYEKFLKDELSQKITLISDPREIYPYGKMIEAKYFRTAVEGSLNKALNVPIEELKLAAKKSLLANKAVWFGCDVSQMADRKLGIFDSEIYNYDAMGIKISQLTKAQKFATGLISLNHAMTLTGVDIENDTTKNWKVENSWGGDLAKKGIFSMSDKWFDDYVFEVIVDKEFVSEKYLKGLEEDPIIVEPWDPLA